EKKEKNEQPLRFARRALGRYAEVLLVHERSTRRKPFPTPATIITGKHHDLEPISKTEERSLTREIFRGRIVSHDFISELGNRKSRNKPEKQKPEKQGNRKSN